MRIAYYPGCTAASTAIEYDESVRETLRCLDVNVEEMLDWTCCGASSGHVIDHELALALPSRNLALAERTSLDFVTPCPTCSLRHKTAIYELKKDPALKTRIGEGIGMELGLSQKPKHVLEALYHDVGTDAIHKGVQKSLEGLKVVTYHGCYLVRPPEITHFDDPDNPTIMDEIMEALGVEVLDWCYKVDCCGGSQLIAAPGIVKELSGRIVSAATEAGADAIVTACSMCQANLDMRQPRNSGSNVMPIFYFSELSALAFGGLNVRGWLAKHLVDPFPLLERLNLLETPFVD